MILVMMTVMMMFIDDDLASGGVVKSGNRLWKACEVLEDSNTYLRKYLPA